MEERSRSPPRAPRAVSSPALPGAVTRDVTTWTGLTVGRQGGENGSNDTSPSTWPHGPSPAWLHKPSVQPWAREAERPGRAKRAERPGCKGPEAKRQGWCCWSHSGGTWVLADVQLVASGHNISGWPVFRVRETWVLVMAPIEAGARRSTSRDDPMPAAR